MPSPLSREHPRELRLSKRFRVEIPVSFSVEHPPREGTGTAYNLSADGCKVASPLPVSSGLYLTIRLHLPNNPSPVEIRLAAIRWVMAGDFGVEFLSMEFAARERLHRVLTALESDQQV